MLLARASLGFSWQAASIASGHIDRDGRTGVSTGNNGAQTHRPAVCHRDGVARSYRESINALPFVLLIQVRHASRRRV
jgi:hypothetical protein